MSALVGTALFLPKQKVVMVVRMMMIVRAGWELAPRSEIVVIVVMMMIVVMTECQ